MKNSSDTIGYRTHDLPTSSAVPQPTAPPRAPTTTKDQLIITFIYAVHYTTLHSITITLNFKFTGRTVLLQLLCRMRTGLTCGLNEQSE